MNKEIENFVGRYNNTFIPAKYKFELVEDLYYAWNYENYYGVIYEYK